MTIYARSDIMAVTISREHGGCGKAHTRALIKGEPQKTWALSCNGGCETVLRKDSLWSTTASGIPETPDEQSVREDQEKLGQRDRDNINTSALEQLSKLGDLPGAIAQLAQIMSGQSTLVPTAEVCREHESAGSKYCPECGKLTPALSASMTAQVAPQTPPVVDTSASVADVASELSAVREAAQESDSPIVVTDLSELATKNINELRDIASQLGVKTTRSKDDQISLIAEHLSTDDK